MLKLSAIIAIAAAFVVGALIGYFSRKTKARPATEPQTSGANAAHESQLRAAQGEAEQLRAKIAQTEAELTSLRSSAASAASQGSGAEERVRALMDEAETLRHRASQAEHALTDARRNSASEISTLKAQISELQSAAHGDALPAEPPAGKTAERMRVIADDADSLRHRLAQAESALMGVRRGSAKEIAALKTQVAQLESAGAAATASASVAVNAAPNGHAAERIRVISEDAVSLRQRLALAERALTGMRRSSAKEIADLKSQIAERDRPAPAAAAPSPAAASASEDEQSIDRLRAMKEDLKALRERASMAETALRRLRIANSQ